MKKKVTVSLLSISLLFTNRTSLAVRAEGNLYNEPFLIESTAYSYGEITKDGSRVREGICAGKEEWLGMTAVIYGMEEDGSVGQVIGIYEIKDTGSDHRLQDGTCIDIYMPDETAAKEYGRQQVYIQLIRADG